MNIEIPQWLEDAFDEVHPGFRTSHQKATRMRKDLYRFYRDMKQNEPVLTEVSPEIPIIVTSDPKAVANRIADMSPAIDDQNWAKIERNVEAAIEAGLWDNPTELRLIARLNDAFDGAENEHKVQNSRISAFFRRLL